MRAWRASYGRLADKGNGVRRVEAQPIGAIRTESARPESARKSLGKFAQKKKPIFHSKASIPRQSARPNWDSFKSMCSSTYALSPFLTLRTAGEIISENADDESNILHSNVAISISNPVLLSILKYNIVPSSSGFVLTSDMVTFFIGS
jgi:hypothetical protein